MNTIFPTVRNKIPAYVTVMDSEVVPCLSFSLESQVQKRLRQIELIIHLIIIHLSNIL